LVLSRQYSKFGRPAALIKVFFIGSANLVTTLFRMAALQMKDNLGIIVGLKKVGAIFIGLVVGLFIAEILVRLFFPTYVNNFKLNDVLESERGKFTEFNDSLGWVGIKNAEGDFKWIDTEHHVKQNKFGFRGTEYNYERTGKRRILFLGDSFLWGFGLENKDIFTSVIEKNNADSVEIVNMGVSGYGNDQELLLWQKQGYKWRPDDVVLMITLNNDLYDNMTGSTNRYNKPVFTVNPKTYELELTNIPVKKGTQAWDTTYVHTFNISFKEKIEKHSALAQLIINALAKNDNMRRYLEKNNYIRERQGGYGYEYAMFFKNLDQGTNNTWYVFSKILQLIQTDVKAKGANFHVAIIPSNVQVYPELWKDFVVQSGVPDNMQYDIPNIRIADLCSKMKIDVIDLLPDLKAASVNNPYLYFLMNRHWTKAGHLVVAKTLEQSLLNHKHSETHS
jgi:hypothetical protein